MCLLYIYIKNGTKFYREVCEIEKLVGCSNETPSLSSDMLLDTAANIENSKVLVVTCLNNVSSEMQGGRLLRSNSKGSCN